MGSSLLGSLAAWVTANPALAVLTLALAPPLVAVVLARLFAGRDRATLEIEPPTAPVIEPPTAPVIEPPTAPVIEPPTAPVIEPPSEPAVAAQPEPLAAPRPEPELRPEPEPEPEPELRPEPEPFAEAPAPEPIAEPEPARPVRLRDRLARTREALVGRVGGLLGGRSLDADALGELEALLFSADLGVRTADDLLQSVRSQASGGDAAAVQAALCDAIRTKLARVESAEPPLAGPPHVILVLGVNGSGKTTTIGKLAARHARAGRKVVLGAGDTFRAAAIEQLQVWGERVGCEVVSGQAGGDPAAVAFDTLKAAIARDADVAIIDTAGRLQTQKPLMEELTKIARVIGREVEGAPHETLLVLDSNTGQNAISQARLFTEAAQVTGLTLTKLDGSAKGGVIVGLADEFGIPVRYVGVGEGLDDLRDFSADEFVEALFETE
jgi:fused signal recognition particle receptor